MLVKGVPAPNRTTSVSPVHCSDWPKTCSANGIRSTTTSPRITPTSCSHHHITRNQCSPHSIRGDPTLFTKFGQCLTAAVQLSRNSNVGIDQSLVAHHHTTAMQDLDDAALTEFVLSPQFWC
jgi:hypothetical protein